MSNPVLPPIPATEAPSTVTVQTAPALKPKSTRADLLSLINANMAALDAPEVSTDAPAAAVASGDETSTETASEAATSAAADRGDKPTKVEAQPAPGEPAPGEPAKAEGETQKAYAHRIAAAQLATQRAEAKSLAAETRAKASEAKLAELEAKLDAAAKDPKAALKLAGMTPLQLAEAMRDGTITADDVAEAKAAAIDPEVAEMLAEHKAMKAKAAADEKAAEVAKVHADNLETVTKVLQAPDFLTDFPAIGGVINGPERVCQYIEGEMERTGKEPDFRAVAKMFNDAVLTETSQLLAHGPTLKALLAKPETRAALIKELGLTEAKSVATPEAKPAEKVTPKAKTLTEKVSSKVPSRVGRGADSADMAARLNAQLASMG